MLRVTINIWDKLIGPSGRFSSENRTVNAVGIITLVMLLLIHPVNFMLHLKGSAAVNTVLICMQAILYYMSRFRKQYRLSMVIYASFSYLALIANYKFNSGITGPTVFLFFLSFQLLIAITPKSQHIVWGTIHMTLGLSLMLIEYYYPGFIEKKYSSRETKFMDIAASYIISLSFIYIITNYLLNKYIREKQLAQQRSDAIEAQNRALRDIAWIQSHKVRNHVATIMGLTEVWEVSDDREHDNKIIYDIKTVSKDLDKVIREINELANEASHKGNSHQL